MKFWSLQPQPSSNLVSSTELNQHQFVTSDNSSSPNVHYPIPILPVINELVAASLSNNHLPNLSKTAFIGVQHMLETTVTLFDGIIMLGVKPENMYFTGKFYSNSPEIEIEAKKRGINLIQPGIPTKPGYYQEVCIANLKLMWQTFVADIEKKSIERIIILDDGGRCLETMPEHLRFGYQVAAIEQTRGGLYSDTLQRLPFPLIEVATSAVKKYLEPILIAIAVLRKIKDILPKYNFNKKTVFGIAGNGAIGFAVANYLLSLDHKVVVYDPNESAFKGIKSDNFFRVGSFGDLIANSQVIFGCTGLDITEGINVLDIAKDDKLFISCTSEDKEFKTLLKTSSDRSIIQVHPLSDISYITKSGSTVTIIQGGYPINFDRKPWNVPAADIEVTQGSLLGACIQAICSAKKPVGDGYTINKPCRQKLDPYIQQFIVKHWIPRQPANRYPQNMIANFDNIDWIIDNSGKGEFVKNEFLYKCFSPNEPEKLYSSAPKSKL